MGQKAYFPKDRSDDAVYYPLKTVLLREYARNPHAVLLETSFVLAVLFFGTQQAYRYFLQLPSSVLQTPPQTIDDAVEK